MSSTDECCPHCGAEAAVDSRFDVPGGFCNSCGVVLNAEAAQDSEPDEPKIDPDSSTDDEWTVRARDSSEEALINLLTDIDSYSSELRLSDEELDKISERLVEVWERNLFHGRQKEHVAGAVLTIALRELRSPRPAGAIAAALEVERVSLQRTVRKVLRELCTPMEPPLPGQYLPCIQAMLEIDEGAVQQAEHIIDESGPACGDPAVTAAAALYIVGKPLDESITFVRLGRITGTTKETVWRRTKSLRRFQTQ